MLVMIRWPMIVIRQTIMTGWPSVGDKFSLEWDLRGRLGKCYGRLVRTVEYPKWICLWRAGLIGRTSAQSNAAYRVQRFG